MIIPIRCFTCGKIMANLWSPYQELLREGVAPGDAIRQLHVKRYCCRRMLLAQVDLIDKLLQYPKPEFTTA